MISLPMHCEERSRTAAGGWLRRGLKIGIGAAIAVSMAVSAQAQVNVTMQHNDIGRTGQNTNETILTPANVNSTTFGKLFSHGVDGYVYAQPLYVLGVTMGAGTPQAGTTHNVVFIATQHDSVYAFDADSNGGANANPLWQVTLLDSAHGATANEKTVPNSDVSTADIVPEIGITSTPVIDTSSNTIYVVSKSTVADTTFFQRLHALDITTGQEKFGGPVALAGSVSGTGTGSMGGVLNFDPKWENNRPGSLLLNGIVYLGFAAHGDQGPYHGWVLAYDAKTLALKSAYCVSPNGGQGGIWMSGAGLAADVPAGKPFGRMFLATGNGSFDATTPNNNTMSYGDSHVRLDLTNGIMTAEDSFTPFNQASLNSSDTDLGAGGVLLLPDQSGAHTHLLVQGGKQGILYVVDRDNMGGTGSSNNDVQEIQTSGLWSMAAYWNNRVYLWGNGGNLQAFTLSAGTLSGPTTSSFSLGYPGATPSISSNGTANGIVWALQTDLYGPGGNAVLHALNATNVGTELYNSTQNGSTDAAGNAVKFAVPTVTNGKVYVGTTNQLDVYGLTSGGQQQVATPAISPAGQTFTGTLSVTITDSTSGATIYYTTDGSTPSTSSTKYTGAISVGTTETISAIGTETGFLTSPVAKQTYTLNSQVLAPTFTPGAGSYTAAQSVTISDATAGSQIYYTTDGTTPAPGAGTTKLYAGAIAVGASTTIKAIATATGLSNSPVASAAYTITLDGTGINFTTGFAAAAGSMTFNGATKLDDTRLQLTDGGFNEASSAFYNTPVNIQSFITDFSMQLSNAVLGADGMTFTIQGVGPTALGCSGGGLGYGPDLPLNPDPCSGTPIAKSIAIKFDFYSNDGEGTDSTGLYQNGASPTIPAIDMTPSGVILSSDDAMAVHLTYDGTTLSMTITDNVVGKTFSQSWTVNIPGLVGGNSAYVGFTGGSGGASSSQKVLTWTYTTNGTTQAAATPLITPVAGTYTLPQSVTISDTTVGASIFYTLNGSTPTTSSTLYGAPIALTGTTTVNAIAVATGFANSTVASAVYTIQAGMPMFTPAPGSYTSSQNVSITDSTAGAAIHYTLDGSTPTASSTLYSGPVVVNTTETLKAIAIAPGFANSAVVSGKYTIAVSGATASPTFSPAAGTYTSTQNVTISDTTAGASIYYTTDGVTAPTTSSTKYVGPIQVASTETIMAMATATGLTNSAVATAVYTINTTAPDFGLTPATSSLTVTAGNSQTDVISIAPKNGFASAVQFSCAVTGPAPLATCAVAPSSAPAGTTSVTLTVTAPAATAMLAPAGDTRGEIRGAGLAGLRFATWFSVALLAFVLATGTKRKPGRLAWISCMVIVAMWTVSCAGGGGTSTSGGQTSATTTPTFSPAAGTYTTAQSVSLSDATAGATIYYTTDGSMPTTSSSKYAAPIVVSSTQTINAMAAATGSTNSGVATAKYTIGSSTARNYTVTVTAAAGSITHTTQVAVAVP